MIIMQYIKNVLRSIHVLSKQMHLHVQVPYVQQGWLYTHIPWQWTTWCFPRLGVPPSATWPHRTVTRGTRPSCWRAASKASSFHLQRPDLQRWLSQMHLECECASNPRQCSGCNPWLSLHTERRFLIQVSALKKENNSLRLTRKSQ